jgi:hypothetical protein
LVQSCSESCGDINLVLLTISLVLVVVGWFIVKGPSETRGEVVLGRFGKNTMSSFPVQVFAYT